MQELLQQAMDFLSTTPNWFTEIKLLILDKFGTPGLIAATLLILSAVVLLLLKVMKISFDVIRYVLIPATAITFVATYFLPFSFVYILPVSVSLFSVVLLVKG